MTVPEFKTLRRTYGFDEVAIVPGGLTVNPEQVEIDFKIGNINFSIPFIASAMDAVTNVDTAVAMSKMGGLSVLHLEGIYTRYENPQEILDQIISKPTLGWNLINLKPNINNPPHSLNLPVLCV